VFPGIPVLVGFQSDSEGHRRRRRGPRGLAPVALACQVLAAAGAGAAAPAREGEAVEPPSAGAAEEPSIHPDAVSKFVIRTYSIGRKGLWKGLLTLLEESGYPPETIDDEEMIVKTAFVDFTAADYSEEVGEAQPRVSGDYTILQLRQVKVGKVSLEARVSRAEKGTELAIRARILVQGLDRKASLLVLTDRRSSGVIEADFLRVLEDRLDLERL
jgi:hypothetical protein